MTPPPVEGQLTVIAYEPQAASSLSYSHNGIACKAGGIAELQGAKKYEQRMLGRAVLVAARPNGYCRPGIPAFR